MIWFWTGPFLREEKPWWIIQIQNGTVFSRVLPLVLWLLMEMKPKKMSSPSDIRCQFCAWQPIMDFVNPNRHDWLDYKQAAWKEARWRGVWGKQYWSIHIVSLILLGGLDSFWSISSECIFILRCNLLLLVKFEARCTIKALGQARPINRMDVWSVRQEAITSQRHGADSSKAKG